MKNLMKVLNEKHDSILKANIKEIKSFKKSDINDTYYYTRFFTKYQLNNLNKFTLKQLKDFAINKAINQKNNNLASETIKVSNVNSCTKTIESISIDISWSKSSTWGYCPRGNVLITYSDFSSDTYSNKSITGYGFDKLSTLSSNLLNQSNEVLKLLYTEKNKRNKFKKHSHEALGYGSGYGVLPYFEGGVGQNSINGIIERLGFKTIKNTEDKIIFVKKGK